MASILKVDQIQENTSGVGTNFCTTGSATTPTISIGNQTNKGLYHLATDKIGVSVGGVRVGEVGVGYGGFTGNVIQLVTSGGSTVITATTSTFKSTGFSCSIVPKYNTSKVLVMYMIFMVFTRAYMFYVQPCLNAGFVFTDFLLIMFYMFAFFTYFHCTLFTGLVSLSLFLLAANHCHDWRRIIEDNELNTKVKGNGLRTATSGQR